APSGAFDGTTGWTENSATRARYRSRAGSVQRSGILVSKAITLGGGSLGDPLLDALGAGVPSGSVYAAYTVDNGGDVARHCVRFEAGGCWRRVMAEGLGSPLGCGNAVADPACVAATVPCRDTAQDPAPSTCYLSYPPDCCQSQNACEDAPSFSLNGY